MASDKKLEDMSSVELGILRFRLLEKESDIDKHEYNIVSNHITLLYNQKLKEERDKTITNEKSLQMVYTWLEYIKSIDIDLQTTELDPQNLVPIGIKDPEGKEINVIIDVKKDPKLDSLTIYALLKHNYRVYRATILASYPFTEEDIEAPKTYKEYMDEYRTTYNEDLLQYAKKAFERDCSIEKATTKVKKWLGKLQRDDSGLPNNEKEHTILIIAKEKGQEEVYKLDKEHLMYRKMALYLHKIGYNIAVVMNIRNLLVEDN